MVVSLSGGKDSVALLSYLVRQSDPAQYLAHYQVLPEDWPETLPYVQEVCAQLRVRLIAQQLLYAPTGDGTGVKRLAIRDVNGPADIVPLGTPGVIAGVTDLALRRGWPPSPATRFCTSYFKIALLDAWLRQERATVWPERLVLLGERAAESPRRARKAAHAPRLEWKTGQLPNGKRFRLDTPTVIYNALPLFTWTRREVFRELRDAGITPHPAYRAQGMQPWQMYDEDAEGGPRTACRFCIYASRADLCHQAQHQAHAELLHQLVQAERHMGKTWWAKFSAADLLHASQPG